MYFDILLLCVFVHPSPKSIKKCLKLVFFCIQCVSLCVYAHWKQYHITMFHNCLNCGLFLIKIYCSGEILKPVRLYCSCNKAELRLQNLCCPSCIYSKVHMILFMPCFFKTQWDFTLYNMNCWKFINSCLYVFLAANQVPIHLACLCVLQTSNKLLVFGCYTQSRKWKKSFLSTIRTL